MLLCYPFAAHRSKVLLGKKKSYLLQADVKPLCCCANTDNKKAEITPKLHTKKVQIKQSHSGLNADCFITPMDSSHLISAPAFAPGEMGTEVCNGSLTALYPLRGFQLDLRGIVS